MEFEGEKIARAMAEYFRRYPDAQRPATNLSEISHYLDKASEVARNMHGVVAKFGMDLEGTKEAKPPSEKDPSSGH
jgi:hypothetical protein